MQEKEFDENQSLLLIRQMIATAKQEQKDDGRGWIIWGWLLFLASLLSLVNTWMEWNISQFFFWNVFGVMALVLLLAEMARALFRKEAVKVNTYTKALFEKLNIGFFISLLMIIVAMNTGVSPLKGFALLLSLYGFWMLIYGAALEFKPSIVGAYITWALALVSLFVDHFQWTMLLHAIAVLAGYIIPGHIAFAEFNKHGRLSEGV